jgi:hypothetical protein
MHGFFLSFTLQSNTHEFLSPDSGAGKEVFHQWVENGRQDKQDRIFFVIDPVPNEDLKETAAEWEMCRCIMLFLSAFFRAYPEIFLRVKEEQPTRHVPLEKQKCYESMVDAAERLAI